MLFPIPYIAHPVSDYLHIQIEYFFTQLSGIDRQTNIFPINQYFLASFHNTLNNSPELSEKVTQFLNAYKRLSSQNKILVTATFTNSQAIPNILENLAFNGHSINKEILPAIIRARTYKLFIHLYKITLTTIGDIAGHYQLFYNQIQHKICPFCGIESFFAPHRRKQDYDHIIKKETYPFPAVNMRNLVPMGRDCNQVYKGRVDVLYQNNNRTVFPYPYTRHYNITVLLTGSTLPQPAGGNSDGNWVINFNVNNEFIDSWARIFDIRGRYSDEFLKKYWKNWLDEFKERARAKNVTTIPKLIKAYNEEARILSNGFTENKIIRSAYFRFLAQSGNVPFNQAVLMEIRS